MWFLIKEKNLLNNFYFNEYEWLLRRINEESTNFRIIPNHLSEMRRDGPKIIELSDNILNQGKYCRCSRLQTSGIQWELVLI